MNQVELRNREIKIKEDKKLYLSLYKYSLKIKATKFEMFLKEFFQNENFDKSQLWEAWENSSWNDKK